MTHDGEPRCVQRISGMDPIASVLKANNLQVREERKLARGMVAAVQPLAIDGQEICADTVLAERITYRTADQMVRETETLTLKKTAFGAFESSMTPIPKYCFKNTADFTTVLVHSIPRFTIDDILNECEKEYPRPYPCKPVSFYTDWIASVIERTQQHIKPGKGRPFRMAIGLPKHLFPEPPHISQIDRKTFAALILRTVEQHHQCNIYHDCISERTIFFPTPNQPLLLSNYSGVPSTMLSDFLPSELMADEAVANYGPQCRDIYCIALICYRIMTGEHHDGKRFLLDSPRPLVMVISEIARCAQLTFSFKSPAAARQSVISLFSTARGIISLLPPLFSPNTYIAWRKINSATGGLWRSIPLVGPFCDIFIPTQCAKALRYVLDKPWFLSYFFRKDSPSGRSNSRGPDISLLIAAFKVRPPLRCPQFESALNALISESALKRKAFGSIMEAGFPLKSAYRMLFHGRILLTVSAIVLIITGLFFFLLRGRSTTTKRVPTETSSVATTSIDDRESMTTESRITDESSVLKGPSVKKTDEANKRVVGKVPYPLSKKSPIPIVPGRSTRSPTAAAPKKKSPPARVRRESVPPPEGNKVTTAVPAIPDSVSATTKKTTAMLKRTLYPAIGYKNVFIVTGVKDSCNPGKLYYLHDGQADTVMISRLPSAGLKLYMTHRTLTGFSSIETIRLCRASGCDRTMYYKSVGVKGIGRPVYVKTGDAISPDRGKLQFFIKSRESLLKN